MAHDFELRRLSDKLKKLNEEQSRINHKILRSRQDEQFELDYVRRRFNSLINSLEEKQNRITKDKKAYERQLSKLENADQDEKADQKDEGRNELHNHDFRHRRY